MTSIYVHDIYCCIEPGNIIIMIDGHQEETSIEEAVEFIIRYKSMVEVFVKVGILFLFRLYTRSKYPF